MTTDTLAAIKVQNKRKFLWVITLVIINTVLFAAIPHDDRTFNDRLMVALQGFLVGTPISGFVFGALIALIPYRELAYSQKYLRASLLVMLSLHVAMLAMSIIIIVLFFMNDGMAPR